MAMLARLTRAQARVELDKVKAWGIQYQNVDVGALARSSLDMIVLDPSLNDSARGSSFQARWQISSANPTARAAGDRNLCIGEADFQALVLAIALAPRASRLGRTGESSLAGVPRRPLLDREWQDLIATGPQSILRRMIDMGFDGALLDRVDAYGDWARHRPSAMRDMARSC